MKSSCPALFFSTPHCTSFWPNLVYFFFPPNLIVTLVRSIFLISIPFLHIFFFSIFAYAHLPGLDLSSFYSFLLLSNTNHLSKSTFSKKMFHNPNNYLFLTIHFFPLSTTYTWCCIIYVLSLWIKLLFPTSLYLFTQSLIWHRLVSPISQNLWITPKFW